ncbi:WW domain-binding protein 11, putative [Plasmodium yoelii]|uniref:WW domain-binding protein 11 n=2 Tax=Plasmodium yoelii TaxID=5861 RepID=A0AAF0B0J9_PLAYO|nr:WW domain-binding protein 11, putative [Plasmodium yoelii]WBY57942.1 WW domain-binding protein 11 [Plasmodium yoelii yoelii]CDU85018.1 WW domain-binding protein 11, putative [Plasmodium yoelii]VTZ78914.1 WW domain-binding protein 11, putative [Plasmodium yoelii]|eukprot:XP_727428.2 WW domain-binding protein 11, putative [Plasmodium yoelii]
MKFNQISKEAWKKNKIPTDTYRKQQKKKERKKKKKERNEQLEKIISKKNPYVVKEKLDILKKKESQGKLLPFEKKKLKQYEGLWSLIKEKVKNKSYVYNNNGVVYKINDNENNYEEELSKTISDADSNINNENDTNSYDSSYYSYDETIKTESDKDENNFLEELPSLPNGLPDECIEEYTRLYENGHFNSNTFCNINNNNNNINNNSNNINNNGYYPFRVPEENNNISKGYVHNQLLPNNNSNANAHQAYLVNYYYNSYAQYYNNLFYNNNYMNTQYTKEPAPNSIKNGDIKNGDVKNGDVKNGDVKNDDVKNGDVKNGDEKSGDAKGGGNSSETIVPNSNDANYANYYMNYYKNFNMYMNNTFNQIGKNNNNINSIQNNPNNYYYNYNCNNMNNNIPSPPGYNNFQNSFINNNYNMNSQKIANKGKRHNNNYGDAKNIGYSSPKKNKTGNNNTFYKNSSNNINMNNYEPNENKNNDVHNFNSTNNEKENNVQYFVPINLRVKNKLNDLCETKINVVDNKNKSDDKNINIDVEYNKFIKEVDMN